MLDRQNTKILKRLESLCPDGSYKVFDMSELCKLFKIHKDALNNNLKHLKDNDFIDIKYADDSAVCLCLLPKARQLQDEQSMKSYSHINIMRVLLLSGIFNGIMAFLGAFMAVFIIK